jgi:hypothetical protein
MLIFKKSQHLGFGVFIDIWSMPQITELITQRLLTERPRPEQHQLNNALISARLIN